MTDNVRVVSYALVLLPYIRPNGLHILFPIVATIYDILWGVLTTFAIILQIKNRNNKTNKFMLCVILFFFYILFTTIINKGAISSHLRCATACIGIVCYIDLFSDNPNELISALLLDLEIIIYINALSILLYPHGMYLTHDTFGSPNNWIMGYDNHWFIFYFSAYALSMVNRDLNNSRIRSVIMIAVLNITSIYTLSGVLLIGIGLMDIIYLFNIYKYKWFTIWNVFLVGFLSFIIVVFFTYSDLLKYIVDAIGKENSMSARLRMWDIALGVFSRNPIMGIGRRTINENIVRYNLLSGVNAHSMWIEILFEGGLIAMLLFVYFFRIQRNQLQDIKEYKENRIYKLLLPSVFAMIITMSVDSVLEIRGVMFFGILTLMYCSTAMKNNTKETKKRHFNLKFK